MKIRHLKQQELPERLHTISDPPHSLYVLGELEELLRRPCLSVVGSRKPTPYGRQVTQQLVGELAGQGIVIISGLALGIDAIAHRSCLDTRGQTIAILPSNLESIYPVSHRQLAKEIVGQGGALVSEYPEGIASYKYNFIERNRLVSGLADGVLIIEAAANSGTLHTASFAAEQNRTLMVVPGNITSPLSVSTNRMIQHGAIPVVDSKDILQALDLDLQIKRPEISAANAEEATLLTLLQKGVSDGSQLLLDSHLDPALFNQTLTMLEITGKIRPLGAGHWALK